MVKFCSLRAPGNIKTNFAVGRVNGLCKVKTILLIDQAFGQFVQANTLLYNLLGMGCL